MALTAFLVCLFVYGGVVYGLKKRVQTAEKAQNEADRIAKKISQRAKIKTVIEDTKSDRATLDSYFVSANGVAGFISQVESIADDTRVSIDISNISIENKGTDESESEDSGDQSDDEASDELTETLVLEIRVAGSWPRVTHFVRTLEQYPNLGRITELSLNRKAEAGSGQRSGPRWSANMTYRVLKLQTQ
jgi:Tfp pilus assembly protein PilO